MNRYLGFEMRLIISFLMMGLFLLPSSKVQADSSKPASDAFLRIQNEARQIQTLQAAFVQKKQLKMLVRPLVSRGLFVFKAPSSIRWEYQRPVRSVLIMHQGEVKRLFEKDGKMVPDTTVNLQAMQVVMRNITDWLGGRFEENPDFNAQFAANRIVLKPSGSMTGLIGRIELHLSKKPGIIDKIHIYEDNENDTIIEFEALRINGRVSNTTFQENP